MSAAPDWVVEAIRNDPQSFQDELDRIKAHGSLSDYAALMWPILEPKRRLIRGRSWDAICEHLEAVGRGEIRRLVINVPPGFSKSLLTNVFFPTHRWGPLDRPDERFIGFSYARELSLRDNRKAKILIQSDAYQRNWGDRVQLLTEAKGRFDTSAHGFKFASAISSIGMGERADFLMVDDPNNVKTVESELIRNEALFWFAEVLPTRLNDPEKSAIVVIQQRTHAKDITGLILSEELNYEWLCLPMEYEVGRRCFTPVRRRGVKPRRVRRVKFQDEPIPRWVDATEKLEPTNVLKLGPVRTLTSQDWRRRKGELLDPVRYTERHLEEDLKPQLRTMGGTYAESGQLQQSPTPRGGGMFQRDDFTIIDLHDLPKSYRAARGYDLAATEENTSPWSAGVKLIVDEPRVIILDAQRMRGTPGKVETWMKQLAKQDGTDVVIDFPQDPGQAGKSQKAYLGGKFQGYTVRSTPEQGSKPSRAIPLAAQAELGNLYLLRGSWNDTWIAEAIQFPRGDFLDLIDATVRAYARAIKLGAPVAVPEAPKTIGG
jgi:predicted phage terminase large subunit-like protein